VAFQVSLASADSFHDFNDLQSDFGVGRTFTVKAKPDLDQLEDDVLR
jgi:hypothetical protein